MLKPYAVRVARTILRRGVDCEINSLSDYYLSLCKSKWRTKRFWEESIKTILNERPRKSLKFFTPNEVFFKEFLRKKVA